MDGIKDSVVWKGFGDTLVPDGGPLSRVLRDQSLRSVFQPIAGMRDGAVHAHEALVRGPQGMPLHTPDALIAAARRENLLFQFELACVGVALRRWSQLRQPGRLFVNISAAALVQAVREQSAAAVVASIAGLGLLPRLLTLEITEHERVADIDELIEVVGHLQAAGVTFALDDFGDGRSSLRLWSELRPDIVKIDKYFTHEISRHAKKLQTLRALMQIAEVFGTSLVAEGIETADDLRAIRDLGIELGQGYLLGRPDPMPRNQVEPAASEVVLDRRIAVLPSLQSASSPGRLRDFRVIHAVAATLATTNDELVDLLHRHPEWPAIAVVDGDRPVGLIERHQFMDRYAKGYFKEVYGRKPCVMFANMSPRLVERDQDVRELLGILTSQDQRYLTEGFIVTENGRYHGLGTADQLVRNVTESRIEAARHANPLTFLPGNIPISEHIERLLHSGGEFVACYADLSHFKPFNDHYGYWRGDEMIKLVASTLSAHCDPQRDFLGHVGGDDFVMLFQGSDWEARCERMLAEFDRRAASLYDDSARAAGGIETEDRHGVHRFFTFTTLYIGAVRVSRGQYRGAEQVASAAARAKTAAKLAGVSLMVHCGHHESTFGALAA